MEPVVACESAHEKKTFVRPRGTVFSAPVRYSGPLHMEHIMRCVPLFPLKDYLF